MVAAQSAVETAGWGSRTGHGFNNWNFGNVTPSTGQINAGISWMDQGISGMRYIAYEDPLSGASDYITFLEKRGLFQYAASGDLVGYTNRLAQICYLGCIGNTDPTGHTVSSADYTNYQSGISGWMSRLSGVQPIAPPSVIATAGSSLGFALVGGAVILGAAGLAAWTIRQKRRPFAYRRRAIA
jgi:hypothetical protein